MNECSSTQEHIIVMQNQKNVLQTYPDQTQWNNITNVRSSLTGREADHNPRVLQLTLLNYKKGKLTKFIVRVLCSIG